jgi:hypothetical protein
MGLLTSHLFRRALIGRETAHVLAIGMYLSLQSGIGIGRRYAEGDIVGVA